MIMESAQCKTRNCLILITGVLVIYLLKTYIFYPTYNLDLEEKIELDKPFILVPIDKTKSIKVRVRSVKGTLQNKNVLFLHGAAYQSKTWQDLGTLDFVASLGYSAFAVDLPGYGETAADKVDRATFMEKLILSLDLKKPVIVSPSMSGSYALPYILKDSKTCTDRVAAYIPIAPAQTSGYDDEKYKSCQTPVLVIYGQNDEHLGKTSALKLKQFPQSSEVILSGAGHACYLDKPSEWHENLKTFLKKYL